VRACPVMLGLALEGVQPNCGQLRGSAMPNQIGITFAIVKKPYLPTNPAAREVGQ